MPRPAEATDELYGFLKDYAKEQLAWLGRDKGDPLSPVKQEGFIATLWILYELAKEGVSAADHHKESLDLALCVAKLEIALRESNNGDAWDAAQYLLKRCRAGDWPVPNAKFDAWIEREILGRRS